MLAAHVDTCCAEVTLGECASQTPLSFTPEPAGNCTSPAGHAVGGRRKARPLRSASRDDIMPGVLFRLPGVDLEAEALCGSLSGDENWPPVHSPRLRSHSYAACTSPVPSQKSVLSHADSAPSPTILPRRASVSVDGFDSPAAYGSSLAHLVPNALLATTSRRVSTHGAAPHCVCASCSCTVTPYWRDGWDAGVMLCNACGLRFQKFARRCPACMYIPRKEDSVGDVCVRCASPWA